MGEAQPVVVICYDPLVELRTTHGGTEWSQTSRVVLHTILSNHWSYRLQSTVHCLCLSATWFKWQVGLRVSLDLSLLSLSLKKLFLIGRRKLDKDGVRSREREIKTCEERRFALLAHTHTHETFSLSMLSLMILVAVIVSIDSSDRIISISNMILLPGEWSRPAWREPQSSRWSPTPGRGDHSTYRVPWWGHLPGWRSARRDDGGAGEETGQRAWNEHRLEEGGPWHPHLRHCEYSKHLHFRVFTASLSQTLWVFITSSFQTLLLFMASSSQIL